MTRAAVVGAGSWGTAFAQVLVDAGTDTLLWARREELASAINLTHRNPDYLPDVELSPALRATNDLKHALADLRLAAIESPTAYDTLRARIISFAIEAYYSRDGEANGK